MTIGGRVFRLGVVYGASVQNVGALAQDDRKRRLVAYLPPEAVTPPDDHLGGLVAYTSSWLPGEGPFWTGGDDWTVWAGEPVGNGPGNVGW
jgi:hypothetical protein